MSRWTIPSLEQALDRCRQRNAEGIACTIHLLDEYTRNIEEAEELLHQYSALTATLGRERIRGGISLKLTSVGAMVDRERTAEWALDLARWAWDHQVDFEIDMEGRGLVPFTLKTALSIRESGQPVVLALQAYLNRSRVDLDQMIAAGITPRLVKGAYQGDVGGFEAIEDRFKEFAETLLEKRQPFHVGTHDPALLSWLKTRLEGERDRVRFGFLMGLSDQTKLGMAEEGWQVSEYIPIGTRNSPYTFRREQYLRDLDRQGRSPAP
jgi:proline dehydrogenase